MKIYDNYPLKSLTKEDVAEMEIYGTQGALRRACSVKPTFAVEIEGLPKLYYREERNPETGKIGYSIHAVTRDICRYLLSNSIEVTE